MEVKLREGEGEIEMKVEVKNIVQCAGGSALQIRVTVRFEGRVNLMV